MIVTGHQPNYIPYPGFFHKIMNSDVYVVVDNVQFVGRGPFGWINRNKIKTSQGSMWLTIPVYHKGLHKLQLINQVKIDNQHNWRRKHLKSIYLNYSKAKFFKNYFKYFESIYNKNWEYLKDINVALIKLILSILGIKKEIVFSSHIGAQGKNYNLIIDICEKLNADIYLSGKHGKDYIPLQALKNSKIKFLFQEYKQIEYTQLFNGFIKNLSIIDLIFNEGEENSIKIINKSGMISEI